jgi:hypothetical protein
MQQFVHLVGAGQYTEAHALMLTAIRPGLFLAGTSGSAGMSPSDPLVTLSDNCEQLAAHAAAIGPAWTLGVGLYHSYCQLFVDGPLAEALAAAVGGAGGGGTSSGDQQALLSKVLAFSQQLTSVSKQQRVGAGGGSFSAANPAAGGVVDGLGSGNFNCWMRADGRCVLSRMDAAVARALMQLGGSGGASSASGQEGQQQGLAAARLGVGSLGLGGLSVEQQQQVLGLRPVLPGAGWTKLAGGSGVGGSVPGLVGGGWPVEMAATVLGARAVGIRV